MAVLELNTSEGTIRVSVNEDLCGAIIDDIPRDPESDSTEESNRMCWNASIDAIASLVLALTVEGLINEENKAKAEVAISTALQACAHQYED